MKDEEMIQLLKEIKEALKAEEGYFVYTSTSYTTALENLLNEFPLKYIKSDTLMADLYEYIIICKPHVWQQLRDRITQSGFKAYCSNTRLPVSGTIGTINAIVEKAQVYGYDDAADDWKAIYETGNALWVRLKAEDVGLATETTASDILAKLDITLSALRDALLGEEQVYEQLIEADESVDQSIQLDTKGHETVTIWAEATTATTFKVELSNDGTNWVTYYTSSSTETEYKATIQTAFRYIKLSSAAAGTSGTDTVTLILAAK
ncbi:MAG: hypothetical protein H0Z19_08415 [Archaeoglobus sp.]|uniref:hypothetical protein n=1 Tax=Archaeoglobus sp. TaxID=1872626 RepID=UPI001D4E17CA|nr:hypothetical protein [Archaeoglobus sp.]MBO8180483.1 hypothetical protein [Archaeoglobus sp.]